MDDSRVNEGLGDACLLAYVNANGEKEIIIPNDDQYSVVTVAREGDATMDVTITDCEADGAMVSRNVYTDIALENENQQFNVSLPTYNATYNITTDDKTISPDCVVNSDAFRTLSVTLSSDGNGSVFGDGTYTAGDTVNARATANDGFAFIGWFDANGNLVSEEKDYSFTVMESCALTAKFWKIPDFISMQEYVALKAGEKCTLNVSIDPETWKPRIEWLSDDETIVKVTDGEIEAVSAGTGYVTATLTIDEKEFTARCRVDVTESEITQELQDAKIQLGNTSATAELYSTDYTIIDIILLLQQNYMETGFTLMSDPEGEQNSGEEQNNGVAIESACFADTALKELFELRVLDDRRLALVPTENAINNPKTVKGSYSSKVTVIIGGQELTTEDSLKLTVKKTVPKLTAKALQFNSFYSNQQQNIVITGATVTGISAAASGKTAAVPSWLTLDEENAALALSTAAPKKNCSGTVYLTVQTEEWVIPSNVNVSVKNVYKIPSLKLSASSVTFNPDPDSSAGVTLQLQCRTKGETLTGLNVSGIEAPTGYTVETDDLLTTGQFTLKTESGFKAGKITLNVTFENTATTLPLTLTVKTEAVKLKLGQSSVTLNPELSDSALISLTSTPADYVLSDVNTRILDSKGKAVSEEEKPLDVSFSNGTLCVETNDNTPYNSTYKVYVSAGGSKEVLLTVKTTKTGLKPAVTMKAAGSIDLSYPESAAMVTATFKNCTGGGMTVTGSTVTEKKGKTVVQEDVEATELFDISQSGNKLIFTAKDGAELTVGNTYTVKLTVQLTDEQETLTGTATIPVKRTAVNLKLAKSSITLNPVIAEQTSVAVSCTTKNYVLQGVSLKITDSKNKETDQLTAEYTGGNIVVKTIKDTGYGGTYKVTAIPTENGEAVTGSRGVTLTVKTVAAKSSKITSTLKVSGTIDVIRDSTAITVTPTYKNCMSGTDGTETLKVFCAPDGKNFNTDVTDLFSYRKTEKGLVLSKADGKELDCTKKYKIQLFTTFEDDEKSCSVETQSALTAITVKMGSAALTASKATAQLYAKDKYSRAEFGFNSKDSTLNAVKSVQIKEDVKNPSPFTLYDYGSGQFAIGFKNNEVAEKFLNAKSAVTSVSVPLLVMVDGNSGTKTNATITLKVSVVK